MKKNTSSKRNKKNLGLAVLVIGLIVIVGVIGYFIVSSTNTSQEASSQTESSQTDNVNTMLSKVTMDMSKTDVNQAIGSPYECSSGQPATAEDAKYNMEMCKYGNKNAKTHVKVTYMNGKVWGTTAEQ